MIGNDLVDLNQAVIESDWRRPRWLQKVFSEKEQEIILNSEIPDRILWRLWSMKESAYKCYVQEFGKLKFNALKCSCQFISKSDGMVMVQGVEIFTKTETTQTHVHSLASLNFNLKVRSEIKAFGKHSQDQKSQNLKRWLLQTISEDKNLDFHELILRKTDLNVPKAVYKNKDLMLNLSLSHHGSYGAFAISG